MFLMSFMCIFIVYSFCMEYVFLLQTTCRSNYSISHFVRDLLLCIIIDSSTTSFDNTPRYTTTHRYITIIRTYQNYFLGIKNITKNYSYSRNIERVFSCIHKKNINLWFLWHTLHSSHRTHLTTC